MQLIEGNLTTEVEAFTAVVRRDSSMPIIRCRPVITVTGAFDNVVTAMETKLTIMPEWFSMRLQVSSRYFHSG